MHPGWGLHRSDRLKMLGPSPEFRTETESMGSKELKEMGRKAQRPSCDSSM